MKYLKLIHWPNLLMIVLAQFLIKYALLEPFGVPIMLNWFGMALLSLATVCMAAGGYVIAAISSAKTKFPHRESSPLIGSSISSKTAYRLFFIFNIIGVVIGFYLSNIIDHPSFTILFIGASALLYASANSFRKYVLLSPISVSFLVGLGILVVGIYDLVPAITPENQETIKTFFSILMDYFIFIFLLNLIHEFLKRQRDIDHDYQNNQKTLPLVLGKDRTNKIIFILTLLAVAGVLYYIYFYLFMHTLTLIYALALILAPLSFILIKILNAKHRKDFVQLNFASQLAMLFSFLSLGLFQFILLP